ncbi:cation:proton antiporter [Filimonas effusa]|uniref:Cation:proton antiporter n=2 Tax=Filimonas effusa TaxID=2508721 RepID=A0A4Q1D054_9BACT|nr:cation:proton antiporter [Filimonas effusa]
MCLTTLGAMLLLRKLKQPYLIAYILTGILLGPYVTGIFNNAEEIEAIGEVGILLFMFFIGMEINVPDSHSMLLQPVVAQSMKIALSFLLSFVAGYMLHLPTESVILIAILFLFNSTPVVSDLLSMNGLLKTSLGITILNMLIFQDVLFAPVLTIMNIWKGESFNTLNIFAIVIAAAACIAFFFMLKRVRGKRQLITPRFLVSLEKDHDLQVFTGLLICLGFGSMAEATGLSGALGSFIAGVYIGRAKTFRWLEHALHPFKVFFVALFFVSIGLRLDIPYLFQNYSFVLLGTLLVFISNSLLSAVVFRLLKFNWEQSLLGGALLSHTGEFGILALSIAYKMQLIAFTLYKAGLGITGLSLLLSTVWVSFLQHLGLSLRRSYSKAT